jgi:acetoin utilization protein AcuC
MSDQPLLVFGPRSLDYDFGPAHPLTPRRFGPGIDLLRAVGAEPGIAPEPASDGELRLAHTAAYIEVVRRFSEFDHGWMEPEAGIGVGGDDPPFHGMHDAAAAVAGGSLRAIEAILVGEVEHAFHPGGGLHHAMPGRASGFCIYDDPALAIARARLDGRRVLYVDVDVHHGDGVEAIHAPDPGVLTLSFHESGRYLFPGSGFVDDVGEGRAAGTIVNVPLEPDTGEAAWLSAVRTLLPEIAATFGPDLVVSQHGADSHAWDPLAHLRNTTTAMGAAARLVDRIAHRFAGGRWLSTGGGGYGVYDVVPRAWSLVWLAAAHRDVPDRLPPAWRERWAGEAARYGTRSLPTTFEDPPNAGDPPSRSTATADRQSAATAALVRALQVPALVRAGVDAGWWDPLGPSVAGPVGVESDGGAADALAPVAADVSTPAIASVDAAGWSALTIEPRVASPAGIADLHRLVAGGLAEPEGAGPRLRVTAAIAAGRLVVGLAASVVGPDPDEGEELVALGVAPAWRRRGLASALLRDHVAGVSFGGAITATVTVAERDVVEPLDHAARIAVARRLLEGAGFLIERAPDPLGRVDSRAIAAIRR